jgi:lysophospholipase L1-like esterase
MTRRLSAAVAAFVAAAATTLTAAPAMATGPTPVYVALGDSYSSGEGACAPVTLTGCRYLAGTNTNADQCHRSHNAYPVRESARLHKGWRTVFVACSGAETSNVLTTGQYGEPAQLAALGVGAGRVVKLVTLTIGGNDAGFASAVGTCVQAHLFGSSCHGRVTWAISTATLKARLVATYAAIHAAAPKAHVVVLGYPRLFSPKPKATVPCDVAAVDSKAFSKAEDALNATIASAVRKADALAGKRFASFVDDGKVFAGHELCAGPIKASYLNGLELTSTGARAESFHPNRSGQSVLATHLRKVLTEG